MKVGVQDQDVVTAADVPARQVDPSGVAQVAGSRDGHDVGLGAQARTVPSFDPLSSPRTAPDARPPAGEGGNRSVMSSRMLKVTTMTQTSAC